VVSRLSSVVSASYANSAALSDRAPHRLLPGVHRRISRSHRRPSSGDRALEGGDVLEGRGVGARRLCGVMAVAGRVKLTVQSEGSKYENSFLACCARAPIYLEINRGWLRHLYTFRLFRVSSSAFGFRVTRS
jgi:hypothetical protein